MIDTMMAKVAFYAKKWLNNTLDHYENYLPEKPGLISYLVLSFLSSRIHIDRERTELLKKLKDDGDIIVYATKYKSHFAFLFYHTRFFKEGLPSPTIGFKYSFYKWQPVSRILKILASKAIYFLRNFSLPDPFETGFIDRELFAGKTAMMTLISKKAFYQRYVKAKSDPLQYLIEMQNRTDRRIYLVPLLMFFSLKPENSTPTFVDMLFGSKERPGKLRRLITLIQQPGKAFVEISEPVSIRDFLQSGDASSQSLEQQAMTLRRNLVLLTNRHRQTVTGPIRKSREEIKENILTSEGLQEYFNRYAKETGKSLWEIRKEADAILEETASNYSLNWIKVFYLIVTWLKNNMFDGMMVDVDGLKRLKEASKKGPLILVPCHKSHIDYLMISYAFYTNNMPCPHIAAGKNLSFWPLGTMFRGAGAFFLRRTFRGQHFYSRIFSEYVKKVLVEGFNIEFYIEGGRSRTGKVLSPKFGMLSILIQAMREGACSDLIFAPIFIGYDRVMEESSYLHEVEGGEKKAESIKEMIKARSFITKRYGKIYINFHNTISLNEYLDKNGIDLRQITNEDHANLCKALGFKFIDGINKASIVTPHAVVASAILNCSRFTFNYGQLDGYIQTYMDYLKSQKANLADTLLTEPQKAFKLALANYIQRKFIDCGTSDENEIDSNTVFKIIKSKRPGLDYYKNNSISFFISGAYTAFSILKAESLEFSTTDLKDTFEFLQDFLSFEFVPDTELQPMAILRKSLKAFIDIGIVIPHNSLPNTYNITSSGVKKLYLFANFVRTYFESYRVVLNFLEKHQEDEFDYKARLKKVQSFGNHMAKKNEIETPEALSKINLGNAFKFYESKGIQGAADGDRIQFYSDKIQEYMAILLP